MRILEEDYLGFFEWLGPRGAANPSSLRMLCGG
jgi:hypothetical protein